METNWRERMRSDEDYNTDSVQLKNVPHEANIGDIQKWVLNGGIFVALDNIIPDMGENRWIIENQSNYDLEKILTLSKMEIGKNRRMIHISPMTQSSPMKEKRRSMKEYQLQQMKSSVPPPPAVTSAEPTSSSSLPPVSSSTPLVSSSRPTGEIPKTCTCTVDVLAEPLKEQRLKKSRDSLLDKTNTLAEGVPLADPLDVGSVNLAPQIVQIKLKSLI